MEKKPVSHFVVGIILAAVTITLFITYYYSGISFRQDFWIWFPPYLLTLIIIIFFTLQFGKAKNHNVTFGALFHYGFKATAMFVLLIALFMFLFIHYFSDYKQRFFEDMLNRIRTEPELTREKRKIALDFTRKYFTTLVIGGSLFTNLITGAIGSLIGASFARKNPPLTSDNKV